MLLTEPRRPVRAAPKFLALVSWLAASFSAAAMGGLFMLGEWNPPGWVFGPVWTALYTMMAVVAWLVWRQGGWGKQRKPLRILLVQLALNALWTPRDWAGENF